MKDKLKKLLGEDMTEEEIEARAYASQKFYKNHFEQKLQALLLTQLLVFAESKPNVDEIRGVIAGLQMIDKWFISQVGIVKQKEEDNKESQED